MHWKVKVQKVRSEELEEWKIERNGKWERSKITE
jgi:hypothetical protein